MPSETSPCIMVPTVDMGDLGAHHAEEPCRQEWERVTRELERALIDKGCAYLTGHGVPDHLINEVLSSGVAFFKQQEEIKNRWAEDINLHGYIKMNNERFGGAGPELHESFVSKPDSYSPCDEEAPPFVMPLASFYEPYRTICRRLLICLALSEGKDQDHFINMHLECGTKNNVSNYRLNYYPLTARGHEDSIGFGAHTDFTTITLLVSNGSKGLQMIDSEEQWVDVPYVPGAILLMAGEFLHFHSYKKFKTPMHRVVVPSEHQDGKPDRVTLAYFHHADSHQPMWPPSEDPNTPAPPNVKGYFVEKFRIAEEKGKRNEKQGVGV